MKINAIKLKKVNGLKMLDDREVKGIILLVSLFAAGMIIGSGIWRSSDQNTRIITNILNDFITARNINTGISVFINSLLFNFIFLVLIISTGFSSIGSLFVFMMPLIRGVGYGVMGGYLFSNYLMTGIGYYILIVFPSALLYNSVFILAANNACFMSIDILSVIIGKKQADMMDLKNSIRNYIVYAVFLIISAATECISVKAFAYLFRF